MSSGRCLYIAGSTARVSTSIGSVSLGMSLGGASFNIAAAATLCGGRPFLVSVVGTDLSAEERQALTLIANTEHVAVHPGATCHFDFFYPEVDSRPTIIADWGVAKDLTRHCMSVAYANSWLHVSCRNPIDARLVVGHALACGVGGLSLDFIESSLETQLESVMDYLCDVTYVFLNRRELERRNVSMKVRHFSFTIRLPLQPDPAC
jgi:sugar/nucleoside kinase (ribokinase family)